MPGVTGLPASSSDTACVMGLSGTSGRYRTGIGVGGVGLHRSAVGPGGLKILGRGTMPRSMLVSEQPWSASTTLPKTLLTSAIVCSLCCESRYLLEIQTGNGSASSVDH